MGSRGQVPVKSLYAMLEQCAPGFKTIPKDHSTWVLYKGKTYFRGIPKYSEISIGHIRHMIRFLEIDMDCARKHLPVLK